MKKSILEQKIVDLGLSDNEASVYLALLRLGRSTYLEVARATDIKRPTVYLTVEGLEKRGLVSSVIDGSKNYLTAENPERLLGIVESRVEAVRKHLPELTEMYIKRGATNEIKRVQGLRNIQHVYMDLLKAVAPMDDYMVITDQSAWYHADSAFFQKFIEKRAHTGARIRILATDSNIARTHHKYQANYAEEFYILPVGTKLSTNTVITPHMLLIHTLGEREEAVIIRDPAIIQSHQQYFELLWSANKS